MDSSTTVITHPVAPWVKAMSVESAKTWVDFNQPTLEQVHAQLRAVAPDKEEFDAMIGLVARFFYLKGRIA